MKEDIKREIEEVIGRIQCPKDFRCYKMEFPILCKAEYIGLENYLKCLETKPQECKFSLPVVNKRNGTLFKPNTLA